MRLFKFLQYALQISAICSFQNKLEQKNTQQKVVEDKISIKFSRTSLNIAKRIQ